MPLLTHEKLDEISKLSLSKDRYENKVRFKSIGELYYLEVLKPKIMKRIKKK